ncbi:MAG: hypothetical protein PHD82_05090, partial [Candidatus Riflebacteria bacterium]|nr:hypothetical protein [Candidatus Riflebacteria bacterium]
MKTAFVYFVLFFVLTFNGILAGATPFAAEPVKVSGSASSVSQAPAKAVIKADQSLIKLRAGGYNIAHARGQDSGGLNEVGKP